MKKFVLLILFLSSSYSFSEGMRRPPLSTKTQYLNLGLTAMGLGFVNYLYSDEISVEKLWGYVLKKIYPRKASRAERELQTSLRDSEFSEALARALRSGGSH